MALPAGMEACRVDLHLTEALVDSPLDPDRDPDTIPIAGAKVVFRASLNPSVVRIPSADPPTVVSLAPVTVHTNANGDMVSPDGQLGVYLIPSTDERLDPHGWTWSVTITKPEIGLSISTQFVTTPGGHVDLGDVVPVPPSPGTALLQWETAVTAAQEARDEALAAKGAAEDALAAAEDVAATIDPTIPATPTTVPLRTATGALNVATPTAPEHAVPRQFAEASTAAINAVTQFGATGAGVADDSAALLAAIAHSLTRRPASRNQNPRILIPAGIYNIHADGLFSSLDFASLGLSTSTRDGLVFVGEGRRATIINLITNGTEKWLYNNGGISTQKYERLYFEHMGFTTDDQEFGNGFKQWSQGGEKQFRFFDCDFYLGTILQAEGTGNADLNRFVACYLDARHNVLVLNNNQSVANEFVSCDMSLRRSLVTIQAGGGGATKIIGGNIEMQPHATDTTTDHFLIDSPVAPNTGQGNAETTFADVRFEIHGVNKKLVRTVGVTGQLNFNFVRCSFGTVTGGSREVVSVTASRRVQFDNCILNSAMTFKADSSFASSGSNPSGAQIAFNGCDVGLATPLHTRCTIVGDTPRITAYGCFRQNSSSSLYPKIAEDFDFGWRGRAPRGPAAASKIASIKPTSDVLPIPGVAISALPRVQLPANAWVKRIVVKKTAHTGASTTEAYQIHVGSADKATIIASSTLATWGDAHVIDVPDAGILAFDTIALWATGGTIPNFSGGTGSIAYIEYI